MMKFLLVALILSAPAFAGDGHNHGDAGFAQTTVQSSFDLTETQIHNLDLKTQTARKMDFFETLTTPAIVKKASIDGKAMVQGFIIEGIDFSDLGVGQTAQIKLDMYQGKVFTGKIVRVEDVMDGKSRLYSFWVSPTNLPPKAIGLKGEVIVQMGDAEHALGIPMSALNGEFGSNFVFVKKGTHFERRDIALGHQMGDFIEVIGGINAGDEVVTQGSYQLQYVSATHEDHDEDEHTQVHADEKEDEDSGEKPCTDKTHVHEKEGH